jgi:hypothetical protein
MSFFLFLDSFKLQFVALIRQFCNVQYNLIQAKALERVTSDILNDFKLAHCLGYITIYTGENQRLFSKEGEKKEECMAQE